MRVIPIRTAMDVLCSLSSLPRLAGATNGKWVEIPNFRSYFVFLFALCIADCRLHPASFDNLRLMTYDTWLGSYGVFSFLFFLTMVAFCGAVIFISRIGWDDRQFVVHSAFKVDAFCSDFWLIERSRFFFFCCFMVASSIRFCVENCCKGSVSFFIARGFVNGLSSSFLA